MRVLACPVARARAFAMAADLAFGTALVRWYAFTCPHLEPI